MCPRAGSTPTRGHLRSDRGDLILATLRCGTLHMITIFAVTALLQQVWDAVKSPTTPQTLFGFTRLITLRLRWMKVTAKGAVRKAVKGKLDRKFIGTVGMLAFIRMDSRR